MGELPPGQPHGAWAVDVPRRSMRSARRDRLLAEGRAAAPDAFDLVAVPSPTRPGRFRDRYTDARQQPHPKQQENTVVIGAQPYAQLKYRDVHGSRMAYVDEGDGEAIVFAHGNPTSSYVWRNVMPHLQGLGRLVAADMIGMGGSDKLVPSGPDRYHYAEHRDYLFALWDALDLGDRVVLVGDDWGATLAFDWAGQHRDRVQGIVHMEAVAAPMRWSEFPEQGREMFRAFRSPQGERLGRVSRMGRC